MSKRSAIFPSCFVSRITALALLLGLAATPAAGHTVDGARSLPPAPASREPGAPARVGAGAPSALGITPPAVEASVPLGQVVTATLQLQNSGSAPLSLLITEAISETNTAGPGASASASTTRWPEAALPGLREAGGIAGAAGAEDVPLRVTLPAQRERVDPRLLRRLAESPDGEAELLIFLGAQADLRAAAQTRGWAERGEAVYRALTEHAARSQGRVRRLLRARGRPFTVLWIANAIAVRGDRALLQELAGFDEVALLRSNEATALPDAPAIRQPSPAFSWGLSLMGVDRVWRTLGVSGEGIVVANIDSGVQLPHDALLGRYRGLVDKGTLQHSYNWFDATSVAASVPTDLNGHGTHTMGTMVGTATTTWPAIGVAPGARWIAARACLDSICPDLEIIKAAQWMLAPTALDGSNPRPDLRPHIVNNSWAAKYGGNDAYTGYVEAWNAAGIFVVFSAGNVTSMGCGTIASPGDYPSTFAVGATDAADRLATFSRRGPTYDGRVKPDITAPGVAIRSAWRDGGYASLSGTSMAAPHVAGLAALLWSARPELIGQIEQTRAILRQRAYAIPDSECGGDPSGVPNNLYGWGRVDAYAAVASVLTDVPWLRVPRFVTIPAAGSLALPLLLDARQVPGGGSYGARLLVRSTSWEAPASVSITLMVQPAEGMARVTGRLLDRWTQKGVDGQVRIGAGPALATDRQGFFAATLPQGTYQLQGSGYGYAPVSSSHALTSEAELNLVLAPLQPHLALRPTVISTTLGFGTAQTFPLTLVNEGLQPLTATLSVPNPDYSLEQAEGQTAPWYDMSAFPNLNLADEQVISRSLTFSMPIYGQSRNMVYISSNGWLTFTPTTKLAAQPLASCTLAGAPDLPALALAPLWFDLNPEAGGAVRAGHVTSDTFVISFEQVPIYQELAPPGTPAYSFQVALHGDGRIVYSYGALGTLPKRYAVGLSYDDTRGQLLVDCAGGATVVPAPGLALTFELQPRPQSWLMLDRTQIALAPGASTVVKVLLYGVAYWPQRQEPFSASLMLRSNDPLLPLAALPVRLRVDSVRGDVRAWLPLVTR